MTDYATRMDAQLQEAENERFDALYNKYADHPIVRGTILQALETAEETFGSKRATGDQTEIDAIREASDRASNAESERYGHLMDLYEGDYQIETLFSAILEAKHAPDLEAQFKAASLLLAEVMDLHLLPESLRCDLGEAITNLVNNTNMGFDDVRALRSGALVPVLRVAVEMQGPLIGPASSGSLTDALAKTVDHFSKG